MMSKSTLSIFLSFSLCAGPALAGPNQLPGTGDVPGTGNPEPGASQIAQLPPSPSPSPVNFDNSPRVHELIRAGNLYLSVSDALALAIENNLDVELSRLGVPVASSEVLRTRGGGLTRGLQFVVSEAPLGVGGPLSPVVTNPASGVVAVPGASVPTNALELGALGGQQTSLSVQGEIPQSTGSVIPNFDPFVTGLLNWTHQTTPETSNALYGVDALTSSTANMNTGIQQGFASGAQMNFSFNNLRQSSNSLRTFNYNPYTGSNLNLTVTQPLVRGFGASLNRRFIRIALNERKIANLLFQQQLIATVYGVIRLYTDFVALYEDEKVQEETLAAAERLLADTREQVEQGTLAPVEMTRANAQVVAARQGVINARGLIEEQAAILKNILTRRGNEDPEVAAATVIPTDPLDIPERDEIRPMQDLIGDALAARPDLAQAKLQIDNSQIGLAGTKNATLPEVDLLGVAQNSGLAGPFSAFAPTGDTTLAGGYGYVLDQVFARKYPTYGIGVQVTLPLRNRQAEADLARDTLQLHQSQIRLRQMENEARLEVEDALIAMRRSRASYETAVQARMLQQQSLDLEQAKFEVGASTSFFVIQYESLLAQAKSTEVAAKSAYVKARAALQRAMGTILDENHISLDAAYKGKM
jgi:outer membrane protein